jgi:hypothetical protein
MRTLKRIALLTAMSGLLYCSTSAAQDAKFTALFIVNFAKYVEWPGTSGDFVVTVLGDDGVTDELKTIAEKTKIGEQPMSVGSSKTPEQAGKCNIIYVTPGKSDALPAVISKYASGGVLIVTNGKGLAEKGAAINLSMIDGKQRYEINPEGIKKSGLVAKPVLFKLGKVIGG